MENTQQEGKVKLNPVFKEIEGMTAEDAVNVLIQAAGAAQKSGALTVRDSVMLARAIELVRPGSI